MKKVFIIITLILLISYVAFAAISLCNKPEGEVCKGIRLELRDSLKTGYMTTNDIVALLVKNGLNPEGKMLDDVSLRAMEEALEASPLIASGECYKTLNGYVVAKVECRRPILRVLTDNGDSYYLDEGGEVIEHIARAVYVPVATGHITREFAKKELFALALYLQENELWNAQIEQICVTHRGTIELVPRVGEHVLVLGRPTDFANKFDNLKAFYKNGLSKVGWNRYSHINIDYKDQVVVTKK